MTDLPSFLKASRISLQLNGKAVRKVLQSEALSVSPKDQILLAKYISSKAPLFYRNLDKIASEMASSQHFGAVIKETLARIPIEPSYRESHFCEIVSGIFAEEVVGLKRIYSKLTLLSAENSNAYKMDLVLFRPNTDPLEFVFGEVKSSHKTSIPPNHHKSCFADLFNSFNGYKAADLNFDLGAAQDHVEALPSDEREKVKAALRPYGNRIVTYAGYIVIDSSTFLIEEAKVLGTRKNDKEFDVDLICVETLKDVSSGTFSILDQQLKAF